MFCNKCGNQIPNEASTCPVCGAQTEFTSFSRVEPQTTVELPMKWHKFLVYFALWAGAAVNLFNGITTMSGGHYEGYTSMVYAVFPSLKTLDTICGLLMIGLAALGAYAAYSLLKFNVGAPQKLMYLYIAAAAVEVIYCIGAISILSGYADTSSILTPQVIGSVVASVAMIFVNKAYYEKREHLFVN